MLKIEKNLVKIKNNNFFYLIEKKNDIKILEKLDLEWIDKNKNILEKINKTFEKWENTALEFFLGDNNFEKLVIIFYLDNSKESFIYFASSLFRNFKENNLTICANNDKSLLDMLDMSILSRYKFNKYKTDKKAKKEDKITILLTKDNLKTKSTIVLGKKDSNKISFRDLENLILDRYKTLENIVLARNLWTMPANDLTPEEFAKIVKKTKFKKTKIKIFDYKKIQKLGMWLIEAVWKGATNKPRVVILERIISKKYPTIGLVWKWVTFDTGWIQVKPGDMMYEMKWDMCWAANVFAIVKELDRKDLKVNIIACLVLAENHISWESYKPSDIIKSYSGKTVDVIHTDAEWRLVLADWISYISKNYKLNKIITMATLTGACMVALGFRYAWIMWTDKKLIKKFLKYSENNFEKYNKLPFDNYFVEKTKSEIADLENLNRWVYAGSTMGAAFLYNFLMNNEDYTHIDIAWTALNSYEPYWLANKGMTGFGVDSVSKILSLLD